MKVLVIGAGAAGVAAAFEARRRGARVRLVHAHAGSSELNNGAVDLTPWTQRSSARMNQASVRFAEALGLWSLPSEMLLATISGVLRSAQGADRALLNLAPLAGKLISVPAMERDDWDAPLLVRSLRESAWARATGTRFEVVEVPLLCEGYERRICSHDFAMLHDAPERRAWLCERLGNASAPDAWLTGPWLGLELGTAELISRELGIVVGETTSLPGGPSGARFVHARERLLRAMGVDVRQGTVQRVARRGSRWEVFLGEADNVQADAVVIAVGGVAAGGIILQQVEAQLRQSTFALSLKAPVEVGIQQRSADGVSSAHGFDFATSGLAVLERVGARLGTDSEGLFLAGDVMAGRPNTVLMAVGTGIDVVEQIFGN